MFLGIGDLFPPFPLRQCQGNRVDLVSPWWIQWRRWTLRFRFPDGDNKAGMMLLVWNNVLWPLLGFFLQRPLLGIGIVRDHDKALVRFRLIFLLPWQKMKKDTRRLCSILPKKNVGHRSMSSCSEPACWTYAYAPFYLIVHGIELSSYTMHEYHEDEEQYHVIITCNFFVFHNVCKIIMYSITKWILTTTNKVIYRSSKLTSVTVFEQLHMTRCW
jgi:hypothetical protein